MGPLCWGARVTAALAPSHRAEGTSDHTTTPKPTSAAITIVPIALHMTGIACADYGAVEEAAVNVALLGTVPGAMAFASHACSDESRRRRRLLQASSVTITTDATVRDAAYGDDASESDIAGGAQSALAESAASGALGAAIVEQAAALDPTSPLRAVALSATLPPTPAPTAGDEGEGRTIAPTFLAHRRSQTTFVLTSVGAALGVVVILAGVVFCKRRPQGSPKNERAQMQRGAPGQMNLV
jgi:hypothetical protein